MDEAVAERNPVPDGGEVGPTARAGAELGRDLRPKLARLGIEDVGAAVLHGDACRHSAFRRVRLEIGCEPVGPAQILQVQVSTSVARWAAAGGSSWRR